MFLSDAEWVWESSKLAGPESDCHSGFLCPKLNWDQHIFELRYWVCVTSSLLIWLQSVYAGYTCGVFRAPCKRHCFIEAAQQDVLTHIHCVCDFHDITWTHIKLQAMNRKEIKGIICFYSPFSEKLDWILSKPEHNLKNICSNPAWPWDGNRKICTPLWHFSFCWRLDRPLMHSYRC